MSKLKMKWLSNPLTRSLLLTTSIVTRRGVCDADYEMASFYCDVTFTLKCEVIH